MKTKEKKKKGMGLERNELVQEVVTREAWRQGNKGADPWRSVEVDCLVKSRLDSRSKQQPLEQLIGGQKKRRKNKATGKGGPLVRDRQLVYSDSDCF